MMSTLLAAATVLTGDPVTPANLADIQDIVRVADAVDAAVDAKDWAAARALFADTVATDFTSLGGGAPATIPAQALIDAWRANLAPSKTSFHARTNHRVRIEGDRATLVSHGYAWNRLEGNGDPLWEVWGVYTHSLARTAGGWRVDGMALEVSHERGNMWVKATPGR